MTLGHVGTSFKDANSQTLSVSLPDGQVGEHPGLSRAGGWGAKAIDSEPLLKGIGVRSVLRRLLVQIRDHFLRGRRNGHSALENDGFCFDLLAIDAFIGV